MSKVVQTATLVLPTICLSGKTSGSGSQETEVPIHHVEHERADGDSTDQRGGRGIQMPCHSDVHQTHQWYGQVGKDARQRKPQYLLIQCSQFSAMYSSGVSISGIGNSFIKPFPM